MGTVRSKYKTKTILQNLFSASNVLETIFETSLGIMAAVSSLIFRSVSRNFPLIRNSCANISTTTTYFEHGNTTEKLNLKVFPTENTNEITNFSTIAEKLTGQVN